MMDDISLKIVTATASQATIECPHCHRPGQTFMAPIGNKETKVAGTCPHCDGVFIIRVVSDETITQIRKNIADSIESIMRSANEDKILGLSMARKQIPEMLECIPNIGVLDRLPIFEVTRTDMGLVIDAKNAEASNILDLLSKIEVPTSLKNIKIQGI